MNDDDYTSYGFMYRDCGGKVSKHEVIVDEVTWPEVLNDFVDFLQHVYGYNIKDSIRIEEPFWMKHDDVSPEIIEYNEIHGWQGEFFSKDEDE
jgi:hypothetical protein